ncbi:hypothetical protein ACNVED_10190 [Legionella sp. D16C41]|uniref:hypothetical protein n=1 Tax=Legionella sp. D16C41 TaxID=3402688 RepID=UPI003AF826BF
MKKLVLLSLTTLLVSCSKYTTNAEKMYLHSRNGATINVPSPLTTANISHFYDLPSPGQNVDVDITSPPTKITA